MMLPRVTMPILSGRIKTMRAFVLVFVACATFVSFAAGADTAAPTTAPANSLIMPGPGVVGGKINIARDKSLILRTSRPYKRISVGNPDMADVNAVGPTQIMIAG